MSEDFFARPAPAPDREPQPPQPPWSGPPHGVMPGIAPLEIMLAANERAAVYLGRCAAYPTGFELEVRVLLAAGSESDLEPSLNGVYHRPGRSSGYETMLRFGIEFADGGKVTNVGGRFPGGGDPKGPVLNGQGGGGGGGRWRQDFWVWPLPPAGSVVFVCEWPAAGIPLTRADVGAERLHAAAGRAQALFPDRPTSGESWTSSTVTFTSTDAPPQAETSPEKN